MDIIDRYVHAVVKRLPEKSRAEVERELRANIEDMLPDSYEEADVHKALLSLGNPAALAEQYRETKRFLISPELYGTYIYVLKIVSIIAALAIPVAAFVTGLVATLRHHERSWMVMLATVLGLLPLVLLLSEIALGNF